MMRLLLIVLLLIVAAAPVAAQTSTPTETPTPGFCPTEAPPAIVTYEEKTLALAPSLLRMYLPLNETAGVIAIDRTGNGFHGTIYGATLNARVFENGVDGAPSFDNVNDYIQIAGGVYTNFQRLSFSMWFYLTDAQLNNSEADYWAYFAYAGGFFYIDDGNVNGRVSVRYSVGGFNPVVNMTPSADAWHHLAFTASVVSGITVYLDGVQQGSPSPAGENVNPSNYQTLALRSGVYAPGNIAHVSAWSDVLSAAQIAVLAEADDSIMPTPTEPPGCIRGTATPTRTPNFLEVWTLAPVTATGTPGTLMPGQAVAIEYVSRPGDTTNTVFLAGIFFSIVGLIALAIGRGKL